METFNSPYKKLNRKVNTWCKYTERLDTYGQGCQHNCKYCYAGALLDFRKFWNTVPYCANMGEIVSRLRLLNSGSIVRMGSMTDCFQPLEQTKRITYNTILWLNKFRIHYLIVTKSNLVASDEYIRIYDKQLAHFQISISGTDNNLCHKYENAPSVFERIKSIEKLESLGFDVSVRLSPFLYQWIDYKIINSIKCKKILVEYLKVNHWIKKRFEIDYTDYSLKYGGHENLQLEQKIKLLKNIDFEQVSVGEYVQYHHKYFSENVNYNPDDCCNLNYKPITYKQLKIFEYENR